MNMKYIHLVSICGGMILGGAMMNAQTTIAGWTFETSVPTTSGPHAAEIGTGLANGYHASASAVYSNPAGNGSLESFSSNFWAIGDYYQFSFSTVGFENISVSFDQTRSGTGPETFALFYSVNGVDFTQYGDSYSVGTASWSTTTPVENSSFVFNLSSIVTLNDTASLTLRLIAQSAPSGTGGTNRVDNVMVTGFSTVPEPSAYAAITGALVLSGVLIRRRRRAGAVVA